MNTFYSKTLDSKYPQYGDYIGRVHYYTANDIIVRWGHLLTAKDKQKLIGGADNFNGTYNNGDNGSYVSLSKSASVGMLYQNKVIPWKGYNDYASIKAYEDYYGIPAGTYTGYDSNGNEYHRTRFMPNLEHGNYYNRAQSLSDEHVRSDLYQVTESYWVSPAQVYVITYQTETGLVTTEMVTDELLQDFLQENGIKKITRTMSKGMENRRLIPIS